MHQRKAGTKTSHVHDVHVGVAQVTEYYSPIMMIGFSSKHGALKQLPPSTTLAQH